MQSPRPEEFKEARHFPALDGLRALAVVLVLTWHDTGKLWAPLHGYTGVTVFFVLSGFLITTLLLREYHRDGRVSFTRFYIRRIFRILPLYYLAFGTSTVLVYVLHLGSDQARFTSNLRYFLSFTNEFAQPGTFGHSWSLGVEEKFYFLWPLLAFGSAALAKYRAPVVAALLIGTCAMTWIPHVYYGAVYAPILAGCAVAILAASPSTKAIRAFNLVSSPLMGAAFAAMAICAIAFEKDGHVHTVTASALALVLPSLVAGSGPLKSFFSLRVLQWIGRRSYAVYLFHPVTGSAVDKVIATGDASHAVARLLLTLMLTLAGAEVLYRVFEHPLQQFGRRLAQSRTPLGDVPADSA